MELPWDKFSSGFKLICGHVGACSGVLKDFFADRNGSFDDSFINFLTVELQIHNIKVASTINHSHHRNSLDEVVGELMAVTLDYSVNGPSGKCLNQPGNLIRVLTSALLLSKLIPEAVGFVGIAGVANMAENQNSMRALFP
jgi:hypothetical protein